MSFRTVLFTCLAGLALIRAATSAESSPPDVILDEERVKLLGIDPQPAESGPFSDEVFALGRIEVLAGKRAVVSSRIAGRAQSVIGQPDMKCEAGDELVWVESRQPGDPPPVIRLEAPIAGIIAKVNVAPGQPVEPSDSLIEIYDLSTVEATAAVPEHLAGKLAKDLEARVKIVGYPDREWKAKLAHLGVTANAESGTLEAAFHVENADEVLRPGMRAQFYITVSTREDVTTVPRSAVQGDPGGYYLYVKHYDLPWAYWKRPVTLGAQRDDIVEITSGLNPGDEVVDTGAYSLGFAGKGSVSLKEALDAAHGHEHNEDGTEMTPAQKAARDAAKAAAAGKSPESGGNATLWQVIAGVLAALLVVQALRGRPATPEADTTGSSNGGSAGNAAGGTAHA